MSKNTGTSELINYFDLGVNGDVGIAGSLDINTIANATTDTDTFLVSDTGIIKYRTGAQLLSDIGAQAAGNYVTTDTSQAITANKSFTVGFSLGSEGSGNQTSFFRNTSSIFSGSGGSNIFGFNNSNNIYFGKGLNNGGVLQWNNTTATRYYTLPDADGTIALTSQIPANPVGGTGAFGRVAYWNAAGTITSDSLFQWNDTFKRLGIGRTPTVSLDVEGAGYFSGALGVGGALSGTSASFSGSITSTTNEGLIIAPSSGASYINYKIGATSYSLIGIAGTTSDIIAGSALGDLNIRAANSQKILFSTNNGGSAALTIASTGAATFSSTVRINADGQSLLIFPTTTNSVRMQIQSTGGGNLVLGTENSTGGNLATGTNAYASVFSSGSTRDLVLGTNSTARLTIDGTSGNVLINSNMGIGTGFTPAYPLHIFTSVADWGAVVQNLNASSYGMYVRGGATNGSTSAFYVANTASTMLLDIKGSGAATFSSSVSVGDNFYVSGGSVGTNIGNGVHLNHSSNLAQVQLNAVTGGFIDFSTSGTDFLGRIIYLNGDNLMRFHTNSNANPAMVINSSGNVGIGTASPSSWTKLQVDGTAGAQTEATQQLHIAAPTTTVGHGAGIRLNAASGAKEAVGIIGIVNEASGNLGAMTFHTYGGGANIPERMRINSGGFTKARANGGNYFGGGYHEFVNNSNVSGSVTFVIGNVAGSNTNNAASIHLVVADAAGDRLYIYGNGNVVNNNNSYGSLSDIKLKENIKDASPKLDDLMKVKVRNYNLIGDDKKQIGVIAQELEEVFPAMIDESEDFEELEVPQVDEEGNEILNEEGEVVTTKERVSKGTTTKSVKYSVFVPMLIKAMQEQQQQIQELKNKLL